MNPPRRFEMASWLKPLIALALLTAGAFRCCAGYETEFYLDSNNYTAVEGGAFSCTLYRAPFAVGYDSDWDLTQPRSVTVTIFSSRGNCPTNCPITMSDIQGAWQFGVTIPANSYSTIFTIPVAQNSTNNNDRYGFVSVAGIVDTNRIQRASLTIQDDDS